MALNCWARSRSQSSSDKPFAHLQVSNQETFSAAAAAASSSTLAVGRSQAPASSFATSLADPTWGNLTFCSLHLAYKSRATPFDFAVSTDPPESTFILRCALLDSRPFVRRMYEIWSGLLWVEICIISVPTKSVVVWVLACKMMELD